MNKFQFGFTYGQFYKKCTFLIFLIISDLKEADYLKNYFIKKWEIVAFFNFFLIFAFVRNAINKNIKDK